MSLGSGAEGFDLHPIEKSWKGAGTQPSAQSSLSRTQTNDSAARRVNLDLLLL